MNNRLNFSAVGSYETIARLVFLAVLACPATGASASGYESEFAKKLYTPENRAAAEKALAFLGAKQHENGSWSEKSFPYNTGVTALACLALMGDGSRPGSGAHGKALAKGAAFLRASFNGKTFASADSKSPLFEHLYATLFLLQLHGEPDSKHEDQKALASAIKSLEEAQHKDGGWRYGFTTAGPSDLHVSAQVCWALMTAQRMGLEISEEKRKLGKAYIERCAQPDGGFRYRCYGYEIERYSALGGMACAELADTNHRLIRVALQKQTYHFVRYKPEDLRAEPQFAHYCFYASLLLERMGAEYWIPWHRRASEALRGMQADDGSMPDEHGDVVHPTAMAAMVLAAPAGHLPFYRLMATQCPRPLDGATTSKAEAWIVQLDAEDFETRKQAQENLMRLGFDAMPLIESNIEKLRNAPKASPEMRARLSEIRKRFLDYDPYMVPEIPDEVFKRLRRK